VQKFLQVAFTMQCNSEKFQPGQIEFLTRNREGIKATLRHKLKISDNPVIFPFIIF